MAGENGVAVLKPAIEARERKGSVTKEDYSSDAMRWVFPVFGAYGSQQRGYALPERLPNYSRYSFFTKRDVTLLSTPQFEGQWANALNIAVTKIAGWDWEIESSIPLRRKRTQQILQQSTAGIFSGWVPFLSAHLRSFLLCGRAVVEIERESSAYSSRIKALHHLNPLRCQFTDDPKTPVLYYDKQGKIHELKYYECMIFADSVDPTIGEFDMTDSAGIRAYQSVALLAAIGKYLYEKVTGIRPLELVFIQGITNTTLTDAAKSSQADRERSGAMMYMGVAAQAVPGDIPIQKVSIPLAGLPDRFDPQSLRDDAYIKYANATGLDVNDIDPRLAVRNQLGSGAQAIILNEKSKGRGLIAWKKQWIHNLNFWVTDSATKFAFSEQTPDDDLKAAQLTKQRVENMKLMVESGLITADQARNLLVDTGDLPREFIAHDATGGGTLADEDKQTEQTPEVQAQQIKPESVTPEKTNEVIGRAKTAVSALKALEESS